MSYFKAVNFEALEDFTINNVLDDNDYQQDTNNTTSELQIENGYEVYDEAMRLFNLKLYTESINKFNGLVSLDIFRMDKELVNTLNDINDYLTFHTDIDNNSDTTEMEEDSEKIIPDICDFTFSYRSEKLDNLRYLAFRNFAMVLYEYTSSEIDKEIPNKKFCWKNFVYVMKSVLITALKCLCFQDVISPDIKLIDLILNFLISFKSKKLTRNVLETILVEDKFLLNSAFLLPKWKKLISIEIMTLESIHDTEMDLSDVMNDLILKENGMGLQAGDKGIYSSPKIFQHLNRYINLQLQICKQQYNELKEEIDVDFYRWNTLVSKFYDLVPAENYIYNFKKENPDPYNNLSIDETLSKVIFKIKDEAKMKEFQQQPNITIMNKKTTESMNATNLVENSAINQDTQNDNNNSTFVNNLQLKRKHSSENPDSLSSSSSVPIGADGHESQGNLKKRVSQRVRNLAEDHQKEVAEMKVQSKYLENVEILLNSISITPIQGHLKFVNANDIKSFEFLRFYGDFQYCISDVYDCFAKWDKQLSEQFIGVAKKQTSDIPSSSSNDIVEHIIDKLFYSLHDVETEEAPKLYNEGYYTFLNNVNISNNAHYQQVRIELLKILLVDNYSGDSKCLVSDLLWPTKMTYIIEFFVLCCQDQLLQNLNPSNSNHFLFGVGIYEMLINIYLKNLKELKRLKHKSGDLFDNVESLREKIEAWNFKFFHSSSALSFKSLGPKTIVRLKWANIFYEKSLMKDDIGSFISEFQIIKNQLQSLRSGYTIGNYNYSEIPAVNFNTLQLLSMKESLVSNKENDSLSKILEALFDPVFIIETVSDWTAWNYILAKFVSSIHDPFVRFEIWTTIFKSISIEDKLEFKLIDKCFLKIIFELKILFESKEYLNTSPFQRKLNLLKILSSFYDILETYCQFLLKDVGNFDENYNSGIQRSCYDFNIILEIYFLIYSVINYETIVHNELIKDGSFFDKAKTSGKKWKSLLVYFSTVIAFSYEKIVKSTFDENKTILIVNFLQNQHFLLSELECCDYANRSFLLYAQRTLFGIASPESNKQLQQCMYCNCGLTLNANVEKHLTEKAESMDPLDSYLLCNYIMKSYLSTNSSLIMKLYESTFLKNDIESIILFIPWKQYLTNSNVQVNRKCLDSYLSEELDYDCLIKNKHSVNIIPTGTVFERIVKTKILLAAAVNLLSVYYVRKQKGFDYNTLFTGTHTSTFNTFENMIDLLKSNIIFNDSSFEAWYLLGECYNILSEYDFNFSAEKLNSQSKKDIISNYQKKSILCFLMSLKLFFKDPTNKLGKYFNETLFLLYSKFGISLFTAISLPMHGSAFKFNKSEDIVSNHSLYAVSDDGKRISLKSIIIYFLTNQYLVLGFDTISKLQNTDFLLNNDIHWVLPVYISICKRKLNNSFQESMKYNLYLCDVSLNFNKNIVFAFSNLLQQMYYTVGVLEKESKGETSTELEKHIKESISILLQYKNAFKGVNQDVWKISPTLSIDLLSFKKLLIFFCNGLLQNADSFIGSDYQERFLKCTISKDIGDYQSVLDCLMPIVSVSSPVKPLITIQRADIEQPGLFFVFNSIFTKLLLETLVKLEKYTVLPFVFKKLKRANNRILGNMSIYDEYLDIYTKHIQKKYHGIAVDKEIDIKELLFVLDDLNTNDINLEYLKESYTKSSTSASDDEITNPVHKLDPEEKLMDIIGMFEQRSHNKQLYEHAALVMFVSLILIPYRDALKSLNKFPTEDELKKYLSQSKKTTDIKNHSINIMAQIFKKIESMGIIQKPTI
ncbi:hypothetical protein ACO0SA_002211 [Hanseniaspora valbyensis]